MTGAVAIIITALLVNGVNIWRGERQLASSVAVARRLLIALWRYVTTGVIPAGAILKIA